MIRRELDFGEGDPFNRSMVQRGKTNIESLGFFKTVDFDRASPVARPTRSCINIRRRRAVDR